MGKAFLKNTADLLQKKHKRKQWQKIMISLSLVVALLTSCLLIHPAITMSRQATCGQEEHTHTEKCYEKKLICNKEEQSISESSETEGEESVEAHTHSDACYENVLICGKQEHTHSEACYPKEEEKEESTEVNATEEEKKEEGLTTNTEEEKSEDKDVKSEDKAEEKTEEKAEACTLKVDQADYTVEVDCPAEANIPKDAKLNVREIKTGTAEYNGYYEKAQKAVASGDETDISFARFFDISFEVDGKEIEPEAKVEVKITYDDKVEVPEKGKVKSVHFGNKTEVLDVKTNEKNGKMDEVKFNADSFSVYAIVGTETLTGDVLTADGKTYTVTVTYGADAKIPEGASLKITEFDENSQDYADAKALVVEKKKAEDENFDESAMGLDALDISIVDKDGKEIEPEAEVDVKIERKSLPEDMDAETLQGTMEVQHLDESGDAIAVTTVISSEDTGKITTTGNTVTADFKISSFSKFTITWKSTGSSTKTSTTLQWKKGDTVYTYVSVHYIDTNGNDIPRPSTINDTYTIAVDKSFDKSLDINSETLAKSIAGFSFQYAYIQNNNQEQININKVNAKRADKNITVTYYHNSDQKKSVNGNDKKFNAGDIYLVYSGTISNEQHVTVHFVDRDGNELTGIKDADGNTVDDSTVTYSTNGQTIDFSQFTKEGYTYSNTRLYTTAGSSGDTNRAFWPSVRFNNNQLRGTTDSVDENADSNYWYNRQFVSGDELYVIFDPVPTSSGGDGGGNTPIADLPDPKTSKTLTDNHDGTYDLNLSITGKSDSKEDNKNINVLFVIDSSSSMGDINSSSSRIGRVKTDVIDSARTLLSNNTTANNGLVEVAAVSFDNKGYNVSGWTTSLESFSADINNKTKLTTHTGTNWEAGMRQVLSIGTGDGDPTYVIFFTDGMPYGYVQEGQTNDYRGVNSHYLDMAAAHDEARAVVNSGMTLYGIFAYGSDSDNQRDLLGRLVDYAYNDTTSRSKYYMTAADSDDVSEALASIVDSITQVAGFDNVKLTDGITGMTQSTVVHGQPGAFTYYRSGGKNADDSEKYDSTENEGRGVVWTGAPSASYRASTGVTWDLSSIGQLEDGVTYTVSFTVWPDQDAYDTVAEINNTNDPRAAYEALDSTVKEQIVFDESTGKCSLKTNTEAIAEYTTIKKSTQKKLPEGATQSGSTWTYIDSSGNVWTYVRNADGTYTGTTTKDKSLTYDDVPAIPLEKTTMKVRKVWVDSLTDAEDRPVSVDFTIYEDGVAYKTVHLTGEGQTWEAEINIAPGIYVTPGTHDTASSGDAAGVMEGAKGHVYTIAETGYSYFEKNGNEVTVTGVENHYDFETAPVKPMLNGTTTSDETDMIEYLTEKAWSASEAALVATNTVKDGIYIYKKVTTDGTDEIHCDEQFTIKVTLKDSEGNPVYTTSQVSGDLAWRIDKEDASSSSGYTEDSRGYCTSKDGIVTLTMDASGRIRIVNVPVGTTFTVEEVTAEGTMPMGYEYWSSQVNDEAVTFDNEATGTTVGNKQWETTITNKRNALSVELLKVDNADTSKTLEGAEFSLFMADGTTPAKDSDGNVIRTLRSGADGKVSIGTLLGGNYVLKETKAPDGYNLMSSNVTIAVAANNVTAMQGASKCTVVKSDDGLTYTVTVTNSAGVELPMTGGSGTLPYTLGGIALIMASALMYGFVSRRRRERRLR